MSSRMHAAGYRQPLSLRGALLCNATWQSPGEKQRSAKCSMNGTIQILFIDYPAVPVGSLYQEIATPFCGMARNDKVVGSWLHSHICCDKRSFTVPPHIHSQEWKCGQPSFPIFFLFVHKIFVLLRLQHFPLTKSLVYGKLLPERISRLFRESTSFRRKPKP